MTKRTPAAGGFFVMIAILGGAIIGAMRGQMVLGTLIGTAAGIVLALLVWLVDRRRA